MLVLKKTSEILCGADKAVVRGVQFMRNVREKMDIFFDHKAPSIVIDLDEYRKGCIDIRRTVGARIAHSKERFNRAIEG